MCASILTQTSLRCASNYRPIIAQYQITNKNVYTVIEKGILNKLTKNLKDWECHGLSNTYEYELANRDVVRRSRLAAGRNELRWCSGGRLVVAGVELRWWPGGGGGGGGSPALKPNGCS